MKPTTAKIDVMKIIKEHMYRSEKGPVYLDLVIWPSKSNEYGNTHYICQGISKEARERGERGPIIGNMKWSEDDQPAPKAQPAPHGDADRDDDIPF